MSSIPLSFYASVDHRALHSFPTRRSSDLHLRDDARHRHLVVEKEAAAGSTFAGSGFLRSEEHTSELQSLRHLVCRLLLEKKKTSAERNDADDNSVNNNTSKNNSATYQLQD